ncbi:MAG: tyrosine-type recombinase/integrase [Clostridiales bacterium]|nr:tyrosine-type recombinase/integrase [Clostridiales bacterium]
MMYIAFLEYRVNGCHKRWYGKTKAHKQLIKEGKHLPPWKDVHIRCHDFRVTFCTICYEADVKIKTLQAWMGHADASMIMEIYAKLTEEREQRDTSNLDSFTKSRFYN